MSQDNSPPPSIPTIRGLNGRSLARAIFDADVPEDVIRQIPAQALYLAVRENGLESSSDIIAIATPQQISILLDLDLWSGDQFHEENFWEWLAVQDAEDEIAPLQKILRSLDLKILGLIIEKYVETIVVEEPADLPPGPGYYTPDKGWTWILLKMEDSQKHFYLGRLLALIFETDTNLFYQMIALPNMSTRAIIEEEAFQDRDRRLAGEDIPDRETAWSIHTPLDKHQFSRLYENAEPDGISINVQPIEPLVYNSSIPQPLGSVLASLQREELEGELSLLLNAAVIRYVVPFHDTDAIRSLAEKVRGAINIGLEFGMQLTESSGDALVKKVSLRPIYQLGLWRLAELRARASKVSKEAVERAIHDSVAFSALAGAREDLPIIPSFFKEIGNQDLETKMGDDGPLAPGLQAIETLAELERISTFLNERFPA